MNEPYWLLTCYDNQDNPETFDWHQKDEVLKRAQQLAWRRFGYDTRFSYAVNPDEPDIEWVIAHTPSGASVPYAFIAFMN